MISTLAKDWLRKLAALNVSRSRGPKGMAPNKPLLALTLIDLFEDGLISPEGRVVRDVELELRFRKYTPACVRRRGNRIDLDLPFKYLASDGLYSHVDIPNGVIQLDSGFLRLLVDSAFRQKARLTLVATYFPIDEQVELFAAMGMAIPSGPELAAVKEDAEHYKTLVRRGRDSRFKVEVISGYHFTCALTGYRLTTARSGYAPLEAAHIHAHSQRGPDTADNGLALTPTAHALFDALLWTITDDLRIQVAQSQISESILPGGSHFRLADLHGKRLQFAPAATLRPNPTHLAWHRSQRACGLLKD